MCLMCIPPVNKDYVTFGDHRSTCIPRCALGLVSILVHRCFLGTAHQHHIDLARICGVFDLIHVVISHPPWTSSSVFDVASRDQHNWPFTSLSEVVDPGFNFYTKSIYRSTRWKGIDIWICASTKLDSITLGLDQLMDQTRVNEPDHTEDRSIWQYQSRWLWFNRSIYIQFWRGPLW